MNSIYRIVSLLAVLALGSCATTKAMKSVTVEEAQSLIKSGEVFWIVETPHGCSFIRLRNEEHYCFEPNDYDLGAWVQQNNLSNMINGIIIED